MPPVTPSPHRFRAGSRRPHSPEGSKHEDGPTRQFFSQHRGTLHRASQARPSQFAATPRFATRSFETRSDNLDSDPKPARAGIIESLRNNVQRPEDVEEASTDPARDDDEEMLLTANVEISIAKGSDGVGRQPDSPHSPKRLKTLTEEKRLYDNHTVQSNDRQANSPQLPGLGLPNRHISRFTHSNTTLNDTLNSANVMSIQHPAFLRPPAPPQEASEPLPDAFSPHRRSQKFVPGGMASVLQQWIVEAGQSAIRSRRGQGYRQSDDFVFKAELVQLREGSSGLCQAVGRSQEGGEVRLLLMGDSSNSGVMQRRMPERGSFIGVREPCWDIDLLGQTWKVGVDWRILN